MSNQNYRNLNNANFENELDIGHNYQDARVRTNANFEYPDKSYKVKPVVKNGAEGVFVSTNCHRDEAIGGGEEFEEDICSVGPQRQHFIREINITETAPQDLRIVEDECGNVIKKVQMMTKIATPGVWQAVEPGDPSISDASNIGVYDHSRATGLYSSNAVVRRNHQNMMSGLRFNQIRRA